MRDVDDVLRLLRQHPEGITALDALREVGTMRLAARIFDLRRAGHAIDDETVTVSTRDGTARVKRYRLAA